MSHSPRRDVKAAPPETPLLAEKDDESKPPKEAVPDAGLRSLDHYKRALPKWRYALRQRLLPLVRWETPYLAYIQNKIRTPALDTYFAITANLGTHTFFMIGLPILTWFGWPSATKFMVHILASGVFFTGFIKDMCSLPRPLSPPLQRITMSGSAALEYGFPSTHSANAVSVAVYAILSLHAASIDGSLPPSLGSSTKLLLETLAYGYALSIVAGRLYCGMHGFVDVVAGSLLGAAISYIEFYYGSPLEAHMLASGWTAPAIFALIVIALVRVHPEPADDCPCFDDSVAFAGVVIGVEIGTWRLAHGPLGPLYTGGAFDLAALGWPVLVARILLGVVTVFAWREVMKPTLLKLLPHLFRVIERAGMSLPRRFFMPASEYKNIPLRLRVDNVMPSVSDLPRLVNSFRHPGRGRSVSIGPQSAADAYETLAYRERRRRESIGSRDGSVKSRSSVFDLRETAADETTGREDGAADRDGACSQASGVNPRPHYQQQEAFPPFPLAVAEYEKMMGQGAVNGAAEEIVATSTDDESAVGGDVNGPSELSPTQEDELGEKEIFSKIVKLRVRYDVEVVTKLIVYTGIAWLSTEFIPVMFEHVGLGVSHLA